MEAFICDNCHKIIQCEPYGTSKNVGVINRHAVDDLDLCPSCFDFLNPKFGKHKIESTFVFIDLDLRRIKINQIRKESGKYGQFKERTENSGKLEDDNA